MVVTIPSVLNMMGDSTEKQFENSVNAIEKWITEQYGYSVTGLTGVNTAYTTICGEKSVNCLLPSNGENVIKTFNSFESAPVKNFIEAAGQEASNYSMLSFQIKNNGRVCVTAKPSENGEFGGLTKEFDQGLVNSSGC